MPKQENTNIKLALSELVISIELEKIDMILSQSNIFEILGVTATEIRHSNFLAWLLHPRESHNLGDTLLKWFLKDIFSNTKVKWINEFGVDEISTSNTTIHRELSNIDLIIELDEFIVVIENKVHSREHSNQLKRYTEISEKLFKNKQHAFVLLSPSGMDAEQEEDKIKYVAYSYSKIIEMLDNIIKLKGKSLSPPNNQYILDYIETVKRYIMKEDELTTIAQSIYKQHKKALDFIFENKPDKILSVEGNFKDAISQFDHLVLGTCNKGYTRFTTKNLAQALPVSRVQTWKGNELFLFEFVYWGKTIVLKAVLADDIPENRRRLFEALSNLGNLEGAKKPKGQKWSTFFSFSYRINIEDDKFVETNLLEKEIVKILNKHHELFQIIEDTLLSVPLVDS
jgi:hypothetical protein